MKHDDCILGLWDGHDAGAALVGRSSIVFAANEERFTRRKLEPHFPLKSLETALQIGKCPEVSFSTTDPAKTLTRYIPSLKERYYRIRRRMAPPPALHGISRRFKYWMTTQNPGWISRSLSMKFMKNKAPDAAIRSFDHHYAHLCSAAFTAGEGDWTVISLDGVGDGRSGAVAERRDGKLREVASISAERSLGIFFEHVTYLLNMRELEDEGKVMALADYASPIDDEKNVLLELIRADGLGFRFAKKASAMGKTLQRILSCIPSEQFAYMAQRALERCVSDFIQNAVRFTGIANVAYAGGVASNIRANMRVNEWAGINRFHIFPHMGDGGLALGAALAQAHAQWGSVAYPLDGCFLGPEESRETVFKFLRSCGVSFESLNDPAPKIAELLAQGEIVLFHQGKMEYGPRALGNRSVLALPNSVEIKNRLNLVLKKRVHYQPFCPSMLKSEAEKVLVMAKNVNSYMTLGFTVKPEYIQDMQGVISPSGVCRPQVVDDRAACLLAGVLREVKKLNGLGVLLNTSLNLHGEPLANTVSDTVTIFSQMNVRYALIHDFLLIKK